MSENLNLDAAPAADAPTPDTQPPETFGSGLLGDSEPAANDAAPNREETPSANEPAPAAPSFNPDEDDIVNVDPESLPPEYQPAKKWVTSARASHTRAMQELADERRQVRDLYQRLQNYQQQQPQPPAAAQQPQQPSTMEQLRAQAEDIEQIKGLDNINSILQETVGPYQARIDQLERVVTDLNQQINGFVASQNQKQQADILAELQSVRDEFNDVDKFQPGIASLYDKQLNPETNKPFTLREAYLEASGRAPLERLQKAQAAEQQRNQAKANATPSPSTGGPALSGGALTEAQALEAIGGLDGFE